MKKVIIKIKGDQLPTGEEPETVEMETDGEYSYADGLIMLEYAESELTGMAGTVTHFDITPEGVTITRTGTVNMQMVFTEGRKNYFMYATPYGSASLSVNTRFIKSSFSPEGGDITVKYLLEAENSVISRNDIEINVRVM